MTDTKNITQLAVWVYKGDSSKSDAPRPIDLKTMQVPVPGPGSRLKILELIAEDDDGVCKSGYGVIIPSPNTKKAVLGTTGELGRERENQQREQLTFMFSMDHIDSAAANIFD